MNIAIVGSGQAALILGFFLLKAGINVTIFSDKTPAEIINSRVMSSQGMFDNALSIERELHLNLWDDVCPKNKTVSVSILNESFKQNIAWVGNTESPFLSVDQRLKFAKLLELFSSSGGKVIYKNITKNDIDFLSRKYNLVVIATGKGSLGNIFKTDDKKTFFKKPMRKLALFYVKGLSPPKDGISINIAPGVGEYFVMPGLSVHGPCHMMLFEGVKGSELDNCWDNINHPDSILRQAKKILLKYFPEEAERAKNAELCGQKSYLIGEFQPKVKNPFPDSDSSLNVIGIGDAIILNDPIAGQGANVATLSSKIYAESIISNKEGVFNRSWSLSTFNKVWEHAELSTQWSNMLLSKPSEALQNALCFANENQQFANLIANSFNDLKLLFPWILSTESTKRKIKSFI